MVGTAVGRALSKNWRESVEVPERLLVGMGRMLTMSRLEVTAQRKMWCEEGGALVKRYVSQRTIRTLHVALVKEMWSSPM